MSLQFDDFFFSQKVLIWPGVEIFTIVFEQDFILLIFKHCENSYAMAVGGHSPIATTPIYSFIKLLEMWSREGMKKATTVAKKREYHLYIFLLFYSRMNSIRLSKLCYPMSSRLPIRGSTCKRPRGNTLKSTRKG